jgi:hypothetical protein
MTGTNYETPFYEAFSVLLFTSLKWVRISPQHPVLKHDSNNINNNDNKITIILLLLLLLSLPTPLFSYHRVLSWYFYSSTSGEPHH